MVAKIFFGKHGYTIGYMLERKKGRKIMERKEIISYGMNTWTKKHWLIMFDEFAIGKIKESITNFIAMQEGYE